MNNFLDILPFIQNLAQQVGDRLLQDFEQARVAITKDDGSLVTNSDRWADAYIKNALAKEFPEFGILTEESSRVLPDSDWTWVIDPLDGTTNFARGIPIWGISIGLLYRGTPVFGYVSMPPLRQNIYGWLKVAGLREAQSDSAAFLNGVPIYLPDESPNSSNLNNFFFSVCSRSLEKMGRSKFPFKLRILGAASYNLLTIAIGSTIGAVEATPKIWDIAAAWVILKAVGAVWMPLEADNIFPLQFGKDYSDRNFPTLVVSHAPLLSITEDLVKPFSVQK